MSESTSSNTKQPILKRWYTWAMAFLLLCIVVTWVNNRSTDNGAVSSEIVLEYPEGPMREIESVVRNRVAEKYEDTEITNLNIIDETDNGKDDYTVLVYLNWSRKNKSETAQEMLKTYSSDLAATLANECPDVDIVNIYWKIPYLEENGTKVGNGENYWIYDRKGGDSMVLKDENWIYR